MNLVEAAVEPGHPVVQQVPREALEVEEQQAGQHLSQQVWQGRGLLGQVDGPQVPVHHCQREDEDQVVGERQSQAGLHQGPADGAVRLQLEPAHQGPPGGQQVQQQEGKTEGQVDGQGEDHGEERGAQERGMSQEEGPERLQQHPVITCSLTLN